MKYILNRKLDLISASQNCKGESHSLTHMFDNFQLETLGYVCKDLTTPYHRNVSDNGPIPKHQGTPLLPYKSYSTSEHLKYCIQMKCFSEL